MRGLVSTLAFCVVLSAMGSTFTQEPTEEQLRENYKEKLAKDFVEKISWNQDIEKARKKAKKEKKPIFAYFTRSYAP